MKSEYVKENIIVDIPPLIFSPSRPNKTRQYSKVEVVKQGEMGEGVRVRKGKTITKNSTIVDYAGELISYDNAQARKNTKYQMDLILPLPLFPQTYVHMRIDSWEFRSVGAMV